MALSQQLFHLIYVHFHAIGSSFMCGLHKVKQEKCTGYIYSAVVKKKSTKSAAGNSRKTAYSESDNRTSALHNAATPLS